MRVQRLIYCCGICAIHMSIFTISNAQTQVVKGIVVDIKAKYPLIGVSVFLIDSNPILGTATDVDGKFRLENVPIGRVSIGIQYMGYKNIVLPNVLVVAGKEVILNLELEESVESLKSITVVANTYKNMPINNLAKVSARTFSLEEVTRFSGGRNDVARLASTFAGVNAPNDTRNDIVVRGNSPTGLLWKIEGIPIASTNHFATLGTTGAPVNALNTNVLRTSDFFTGAFPAEYGNANAAVFDVNFRNGNADKYEFTGQVAFTGVELMAEGPIYRAQNSSFLASYRYGIAAIVATGTTAIPYYQDFSFKINLGKGLYGRFELFGLGGLSHINFLGDEVSEDDLFSNPDQDAYVQNRLGLMGVSNTLQLNKSAYLKTSLGVSINYNQYLQDNLIRNVENGELLSKYRAINVKNQENRYTLSTTLNKKFNAKWSLRTGLLSELYGVNFFTESKNIASIPDNDGDSEPDYFLKALDINDYYNVSQLFAQAEYKVTDNLDFTLGFHTQYHSLTQKFMSAPRMATSWQFSKDQRLSLAYGLHAQSIASPILFYEEEITTDHYVQTNKKLDFMKSHHIVLAYDVTPGVNWRIKSEFYYQGLFSIPIEEQASSYSVINEGADFAFTPKGSLKNDGKGENYGVELTIEKFLSKGYYLLSTTSLYKSTYKGSDGISRSTAFDNGLVSNLLVGKEWLFGKNKQNAIMLDTKLTIARGKPYTPIDLEATRETTLATKRVVEMYIYEEAYSKRAEWYYRWDVKVGVRASIKNTSHEWFVEVQNVINQKNEFLRRYSKSKDEISVVRQTGIYPVFMYRIRF